MLAAVFAALPAYADLESDLVGILEESAVVGAGIVVVEDGQPFTEVYWGLADKAAGIPVTPETVFRVGSISKNVTSLIAVRLAAEGVLDLEAEVGAIAPEMQIENKWADTNPVTVAQLLEHTAGLPGSSYREYGENRENTSPAKYLELRREFETRWPPGTFYSYSNAGHTILARILEIVSGRDFDALAQDYVFGPLAMESASFLTYGKSPDLISKSYALGGEEETVWEMLIRPSGSLLTTPRDLARLAAFYAQDGRGIVPADDLARMRRSETGLAARAGVGSGAYGLGTFPFIVEDQVFYGHWGKTEGFRANMGYLPGKGAGFVLMLNVVDERAALQIRQRISDYFTGRFGPADNAETLTVDKPKLKDLEGTYILSTHEQPARQWLFQAFAQRRITATDAGLKVEGIGLRDGGWSQIYKPAADGGFAVESAPLATASFEMIGGRGYWISRDAYLKVSALEAMFRRLILPIGVIISIICLLHGVMSGGLALAGRWSRGAGLKIQGPLFLSGLGFVATCLLYTQFGLLGSWRQYTLIGKPSIVSFSLAGFSLLAVVFALISLWLTARDTLVNPRRFSVWASTASAILSAFAILWILSDWAPLISWAW
ncbi:MAG: serine hydrolase domain-containing protein [Pseudomonadota bacterium]